MLQYTVFVDSTKTYEYWNSVAVEKEADKLEDER